MNRLPLLTRDGLPEDARQVWDSLTATRGSVVTADGTLVGPFNAERPFRWLGVMGGAGPLICSSLRSSRP